MQTMPTKKQFIGLIIFISLILILPLIILLTKKNSDNRSRAAGSGEVSLFFSPTSGSRTIGQSFPIEVKFQKNASVTRPISISGAQATITVDDKFDIVPGSASCLAPYDGLPLATVNGQTIRFLCAVSITSNLTPISTAISFATFRVTPKSTASINSTAVVDFTATKATEAGIEGSAPDVSTEGTDASFTIADQANATITLTSTPSEVNPTNTPVPSITSSPEITVTMAANPTLTPIPPSLTSVPSTPSATAVPTCSEKPIHSLGNANDDCYINALDYSIWLTEFKGEHVTTVADFNNDDTVNIVDYEIWRRNRTL